MFLQSKEDPLFLISLIILISCRTSPEEFLARLSKVEDNNKEASGDSKERDFSMPTKPKSGLARQVSMKKEKVLVMSIFKCIN